MASTRVFLATIAIVLCWGEVASARVVPEWPYTKLIDRSDAVVIVEKISSKDTQLPADDNYPADTYRPTEETFRVYAALKGKLTKNSKILFVHYVYQGPKKKGGIFFVPGNDGERLWFTKLGPVVGFSLNGKPYHGPSPQYLLFLRKRKDGRFEPISGHVDPYFSAKKLDHAAKPKRQLRPGNMGRRKKLTTKNK